MYPKTQQAASDFSQLLKNVVYSAVPRIEAATVVDVANYQTIGFVIASSGRGQVQVFGVPTSAAVRGTRIYIQATGPERNQRYVWTATASACVAGGSSGSIQMVRAVPINTSKDPNQNHYSAYPGTPVPQMIVSGSSGSLGYFWSFFLNVPSLPSHSAVIFELQSTVNTTMFGTLDGVRGTVEPDGTLKLISYTDNVTQTELGSYRSIRPIEPGKTHFVVWQCISGTNGQALYLDGYSRTETGQTLWTTQGGVGLSTGYRYYLNFFNSFNHNWPCPVGTWISKFTYGVSLSNGVVQTPIKGVPTNDSQIPNGRQAYNNGLRTFDLWLNQFSADSAAADSPGLVPVSYPDSGVLANYLTFDAYYITGKAAGPY